MLAAFKSGADIHRMNACFTYDTRIITLSGPVKIGDLAKDYEEWYDKSEFRVPVISYDIENDKMVVAYATHPRKVETNSKLLKLTFRSGVVIKCTDDHRFLNSNNQWIPAYMTLGVLVRTPSLVGEYDKVETIQNISSEDVYDITVDKYENFLVSDGNCKKKVIVTLEDSPKTMPDNTTSYARSELEISYGVVAHNSQVWKKPPEDITDAERRFSKMVTFAILYGADYHNIANNFMDGDIDAAKELLDRFYGAFPKLKSWIDQMQNLWKSTGYVTLITNRIIKIRKPDKFDKKYKYKYSKALRQSQNFPIQGAASDIAGNALEIVIEYILNNNYWSKCFSFVHDALYLDLHPLEIFKVPSNVFKAMNVYPLEKYNMPVKADMVLGYSMGEELELIDTEVICDDGNILDGTMTLSGFKDELDKLVDNYNKYYDSVEVEILESKPKYVYKGELFVPKKAVSRRIGNTYEHIKAKVHIYHVVKDGDYERALGKIENL